MARQRDGWLFLHNGHYCVQDIPRNETTLHGDPSKFHRSWLEAATALSCFYSVVAVVVVVHDNDDDEGTR